MPTQRTGKGLRTGLGQAIKGKAGRKSLVQSANEVFRAIGHIRGTNGTRVKHVTGQYITVVGGAAGVSEAMNQSFYATINQAQSTVTIKKGYVLYHGKPLIAVPQTNVAITGGTPAVPHWVIVRVSKSNPTAGVVVNPAIATAPSMTSTTHWEFPLYTFFKKVGSGTICLDFIWHRGANLIINAGI